MTKLLTIFSFLFILPIICRSQTDTTYYDKKWKKSNKADAAYYRVYHLKPNQGYKAEDHFIKSNKLQMSGYFTSKDSGAAKNGLFVYYDEEGFKTLEETYDHNILTGDCIYYYHRSKDIRYIDNYQSGKLVAITCYYSNGKLRRKETLDNGQATGKCFDEQGKEIDFTPFESMPKPSYDLSEYLGQNLVYPYEARKANIEGRVIIKFAVDESGNIINAEVTQHVRDDLDKEALRVVSKMPKWIPGIQNDEPVKVYFNLPVQFKLTD